MGNPVTSQGLDFETVVIASGASLTSAINLGARKLVGIIMPSAWTAAALTFSGSNADDGTFVDIYDGATERSYAVTASKYLMLAISDWVGVKHLKIRSGTTGTPVNQGAARSIILALQP